MKLISVISALYLITLIGAVNYPCPDICEKCDGPYGNQCIECKPNYFSENGICKPCHDSCARCNGPLKADCLPESFYSILNTHRALASGDISNPKYGPINLATGFDLYYEFKTDSTIDLMIKNTAGQGYFAIGFGTSMTGADMIICLPSGTTVTCSQYTGNGHVTPSLDGTQKLTTVGYDISTSAQIVKLNRLLNTGESGDKTIVDGENEMIWAYHASSTTLVQHSNRGATTVTLSSTGTSPTSGGEGSSSGSYVDALAMAHGLIIFFGWGLAVDLGLIFMAIGRKYPAYLIIHSLSMWYTTISTIIVIALMLARRSIFTTVEGYSPTVNAHFVIGLMLLGLMILQHIGGLAIIIKSKGKQISRKFYRMRLGHRLNGTLLYTLAKVNIFIGVKIYAYDNWFPWIIPIEAVLITLNVLLRLWMSYRDTQHQPLVSRINHKLMSQQQKLVSAVNEGKTREQLLQEFPKMKFAYLYNRIYDLTSFEHPGGDFIIPRITGREVGRFLNGAYYLEEIKGNPHRHAPTSVAILNRYWIGDMIQGEKSILVDANGKPTTTPDFVLWKFVGKKALTKSTACFEFQNSNYQIKNDLKGVSWIGRHFYLSKDLINGPARPYTVCNSLGESWTGFRKAAIEFFDGKMQGEANLSTTLPTLSPNLNFVIKQYHNPKSTPLSGYLHTSLASSNSILINGPVGRGLEILDNSRGTHYALAVGTGILPFMDLLNFLLFKSMYLALKQKFGPEVAQRVVPASLGTDYETTLAEGFKLVLVVAYADSNDAIGFDIVSKTAEINTKYNLGLFEAHVKGGPEDQYVQKVGKRIDEQFLKEHMAKDATKFLVCGSPVFNEAMPKALQKLGVDPKKITLV